MYGNPDSYSDWAKHFERRRARRARIKRAFHIAAAITMVVVGSSTLVLVACAPVVS